MTRYTIVCVFAALMLFSTSCKKDDGEKAGKEKSRENRSPQTKDNYVDTLVLKKEDFKRQILCNGKLSAVLKSEIALQSSGIIKGIKVRNGELVQKGTLMASTDTEDAERAVERARRDLEKAEVDMVDRLLSAGYDGHEKDIPEAVLKRTEITSGLSNAKYSLQTAEKDLKNCFLYAPYTGRVADLKSKVFQKPSGTFCTLVDDSRFDVDFKILEAELDVVKPGLKVLVSPFINEDRIFEGTITEINPIVDEKGQINVRARIDNSGNRLMDGMNVKIVVENRISDMYVVPRNAVVERDGFHVIFLYSDGEAVWTYVDVLDSNIGYMSVSGCKRKQTKIKEGDIVIVSGNMNLADGTPVIPRAGKKN